MPPKYTWTSRGDVDSGWVEMDNVWYGEQEEVEWYDPATTQWEELYHEEDFQGIANQLRAEELGLPTL